MQRKCLFSILLFFSLVYFPSCKSAMKVNNLSLEAAADAEYSLSSEEEVLLLMQQSMLLSGGRRLLVEEASGWLGTPYLFGGDDKENGTDCSGLVMHVVENALNLRLPRNSAKQAEFCREISVTEVGGGDLVFFATGSDPNYISHVGLMLDNEKFVHASTSKGVIITSINSPYYQDRLVMFGRIDE